MLRKGFEKTLLILSFTFGLLSVIITSIIIYGWANDADYHNQLMRTLVTIISFVFIASAVGYFYLAFSSSKAVNEILIYQSECSRTKVTKGVIRKLVTQAVGNETFVRINRIKLLVADGTLHFIIYISLSESNVPYHVDYIKALIENVLEHTLKLDNYRADFKVKKLNTNYEVPRDEIMNDVKARYEKEAQAKQQENESIQENLSGKEDAKNGKKPEKDAKEKAEAEDDAGDQENGGEN